MIGHNSHSAPPCAQQSSDAIDKSIDLRIDLPHEQSLKRVSEGIQPAGFGPAACLTAGRYTGLVLVEDFHACSRHGFAEARRGGGLVVGGDHRREVLGIIPART